MKLSEVKIADVKAFCRAEDAAEEEVIFSAILDAAKQFVLSQTGMTEEEADTKADMTLAMLMFCDDLYEKRSYGIDANKEVQVNPAVKAILDQYNMNIL